MRTHIKKLQLTIVAVALSTCFCAGAAPGGLVLEANTMDRTADPCSDFYQYANGNWLREHPIPADRSRYSAYDEVTERNLLALKKIAEDAVANPNGNAASVMVGHYYHSGMDTAKIEQLGIQPLAPFFHDIDAIQTKQQLLAQLARLHQIGVAGLFNFYVDQDAKNSERYIPQMVQGGLGLPDRDYYLKNDAKTREIRNKYVSYLKQVFILAGDAPDTAGKNAASVIAIETRLAKASMSKVDLRDPQASYHLLDSAGLKKMDVHTDWQNYFKSVGLPELKQINVGQPKFFAEVGRMLDTVPMEQWRVYLRLHTINSKATDLSSAFVNAHFDFYGHTLAGTQELQPRWKRVLTSMDANIGDALGQLYAEQYFGAKAKAGAIEMVNQIKQAMRDSIARLEWMSPATKAQAYRKLDTLMVKIGYPDNWRDYSTLTIDGDSYFENINRANVFEFQRNLNKLGKPIDKTEWGMTAPTVNAYYNPTLNEIVFPAGILQPPLFHIDADAASNYGNTGATIGHELTHAFDDEGRQFDADGNLKSWWSKNDESNFLRRVSVIEKQFDEYTPIDNIHINGKLTAGENIADLGGLKIALQALNKTMEGKPPVPDMDGLNPVQRFFVAYAQSFRGNVRPENLRLQLATDPHSPEKYRVIAPLANMPEFAKAFNCPAERSPLRPVDKRVNIW
jgi:putative endopeptidase